MTAPHDWRDAAERVLAERRGGGGLFEPRVAWGDDGTVVAYLPSGSDGDVAGGGGAGISAADALLLEGSKAERLVRCAGAAVREALREIAVGGAVEIVVGDGGELVAACGLVLVRRERGDLKVGVAADGGSVGFRRCLQNLGVPVMQVLTAKGAKGAKDLLSSLSLSSVELHVLAAHFTRHGGLIPESLSRPPLPA